MKNFIALLFIFLLGMGNAQANDSGTLSAAPSGVTKVWSDPQSFPAGSVAVTQTLGDNTTKLATDSFVQANIAASSFAGISVNPMQAPFNAKCDGSTDDTAAFNAAFAASFVVELPVTARGCAVNALAPPSYSALIGHSAPLYSDATHSASRLVPASGASYILDPSASSFFYMSGVDLYGGGYAGGYPSFTVAVACMKGGSTSFSSNNNGYRYCGNGAIDSASYTKTFISNYDTFYGNGDAASVYALSALIDSKITNANITSNYGGIYYGGGASTNLLASSRVEWNTHFGILCYQSASENFTGIQFDREYSGDISFTQCSNITDAGSLHRRGGRTNTYGNNAAIYSGGGNDSISITSATFLKGQDDGGTGTITPAYDFLFNDATDTNFLVEGNTVANGFVTGFVDYNAAIPAGLVLKNNIGQKDVKNGVPVTSYAPRPYISGNAYIHGPLNTAAPNTSNSTALVNNTVYAVSGIASQDVTITTVNFKTSSSSASVGASAKICVYGQTSAGLPGALLGSTVTGTSITNSATNTVIPITLDSPAVVPAGQFFIGILTTSTTNINPTILGSQSGYYTLNGGSVSDMFNSSPNMGYTVAQTYSSGCPNPFGTPTNQNNINFIPAFTFTVQ